MRALMAVAFCIFAATSAHAMSMTKQFDGGSVTCSTDYTVVFGQKHPFGNPKNGARREVVSVIEKTGEYWYVIDLTAQRVPPRNIGKKSTAFSVRPWVFSCTFKTDVGVAHTCAKTFQGMAGSCVVCREKGGKDRCGRVSFKMERHLKKE